ncbi:MAG: IS30 family transposase [Patescibacteria group bacterium]
MSYKHLSVEEREAIQEGLWKGRSIRDLAKDLRRSHTAVVRELQRNRSPEKGLYRPRIAHEKAMAKRKSRGRKERLRNDRVRLFVVAQLKRRRSPEQIAGIIKGELGESISHEAIYQFIYAQVHRKGYGWVRPGCEDLRPCLRRRRKRRIPPGARRCQRVLKPNGPSIEERPRIVDERTRVGDWESDTIESRDHKPGLNTLVERKTGLVFITKLKDKSGAATRAAIEKRLTLLPKEVRLTLTMDNGPENRDWQPVEATTGVRCFFAHPYSSWERGTNENTNGLIRDYFPKGTDFGTISDQELAFVERELNERPRKRHGWQSPLQIWGGALPG